MNSDNFFWFSPEESSTAISTAQAKNLGIIIFVQDRGYLDQELEDCLADEKTSAILVESYVGLRLPKDHLATEQFNQLVPITEYPCLFVFYDGKLRDKIPGFGLKAETIASRLAEVFKPEKNADNDIVHLKPSLEDKKLALEEKRQIKKELKEKDGKEKELERRKQAKELQEANKALKERETRMLVEAKAREKREEAEHRRLVKERIAQDKAERLARRQNLELATNNQNPASSPNSTVHNDTSATPTNCRLNLRMMDGKEHRCEFEASSLLEEVREHVATKLLNNQGTFELIQTFPRLKFTSEHEKKSLRELGLCPSNTLLVKISESASFSSIPDVASGALGTVSSWVGWGVSSTTQLVESFFASGGHPPSNQPPPARTTNNRIASLKDLSQSSSKDDQATYNGNSTNQQ